MRSLGSTFTHSQRVTNLAACCELCHVPTTVGQCCRRDPSFRRWTIHNSAADRHFMPCRMIAGRSQIEFAPLHYSSERSHAECAPTGRRDVPASRFVIARLSVARRSESSAAYVRELGNKANSGAALRWHFQKTPLPHRRRSTAWRGCR